MTTKSTPTTTKAAPELPEGQEGTKLAQVNDPAKVTAADIKEITKDDGSDDPENAANKDAADTLKDARTAAKKKDDPTPPYFAGQGGAAGL